MSYKQAARRAQAKLRRPVKGALGSDYQPQELPPAPPREPAPPPLYDGVIAKRRDLMTNQIRRLNDLISKIDEGIEQKVQNRKRLVAQREVLLKMLEPEVIKI